MFIKDIKKAEVDLKLLNRDRRVNVAETEKLQRMIDRKKRHLDQQVIDDTGSYEKEKVDIENVIEWSPYMKVKRFDFHYSSHFCKALCRGEQKTMVP